MTAVRHDMGLAFSGQGVRLSRVRVPWTRGATTGALLVLLGAWAGFVPFIGPYMHFAYTPQTTTTWHWTAARGWFEVLPGVVAFTAGLMLLISTYRSAAVVGSWLGIAAGGWLIVGPSVAGVLNENVGTPDPSSSTGVRAMEQLFFFYAVGGLIVLFAAVALGRLSVRTIRDLTAAERRAAETAAAMPAAATAQPVAPERPVAAEPMASADTTALAESPQSPESLTWPGTPPPPGAHRQPYQPPEQKPGE